MSLQRLPLTFGQGLDRASGVGLVDPRSFTDLRNVELVDGAAQSRKGLAQVYALTGPGALNMNDVLLNEIVEFSTGNLSLGWRASAGDVRLFYNGADQALVHTGVSPAPTSLRFFSAEINGMVFVAHDQPYDTTRLKTRYWGAVTPTVTDLTADLNGVSGVQPIEFRGVVAYLDYLVGWGYGHFTENPREELVRISLPGQPTVFKPEHYLIIGQRGSPVLNCVPVGGRLLAFKPTQIIPIIGTNRANFGSLPAADKDFGLAGSRLAAVASSGVCYFWSQHGPRATAGGASVEIGLPLKLDAPEPSDLVASGAASDGFAQYVPGKEHVRFVFGRRCYTLHLRDPGNPRWSYDEFAVAVRSGGRHYVTAGGDLPNGAAIQPAYGRSGGHRVLTLTGSADDGASYQASGKTVPVAPAGSDGECSFRVVTLSVTHTMAVTLRVTAYVNGVALAAKDWALGAQGSRTLAVKDFRLAQPYSPGGTETTRADPRGAWFSVKVETLDLAAGDLIYEEAVLEFEVVRERRAAA